MKPIWRNEASLSPFIHSLDIIHTPIIAKGEKKDIIPSTVNNYNRGTEKLYVDDGSKPFPLPACVSVSMRQKLQSMAHLGLKDEYLTARFRLE